MKLALHSPNNHTPNPINLFKTILIISLLLGFILIGFPFYKNFIRNSSKNTEGAVIINRKLFNKNYNIIIYVIDALRPDHLNIYGYPRPTSPFISLYGKQAYVFINAFSISAWSRPSIGTLLTSLYPAFHGASNRSSILNESALTLPEVLKKFGYKTAAFIANGNIFDPILNFDQGFHFFQPINSSLQTSPSAHNVITTVNSWLRKFADQNSPFFLYIHTVDSHEPYRYFPHHFQELQKNTKFPPRKKEIIISRPHMEEFFNRYDASIRYSDFYFSRFIESLEKFNLIDKSIIILTADHGEEFLDHGSHQHGGRLFIEQISVPLLIWLPKKTKKPGYIKEMVSHLDISPTILDLIGLKPPPSWQGTSFAELMIKENPSYRKKEIYFMEELDENKLYAVISENYHYILRIKPELEEFLFNLETDPFELTDISKEDNFILSVLKNKLLNFIAETMPGYHLRIVPPSEQPLKLQLETKGKFENIISNQHIPIEINPEKNKILIEIKRRKDCFFFSVNPAKSSILVQKLNTEIPFFLGRRKIRIDKKYVILEERSQEIQAELGLSPKAFTEPGIYIWQTIQPVETELKLDPQTIKNLKSLGYIH